MTFKIREFGGELALEIPASAAKALALQDGDQLTVHCSALGVFLRRSDTEFDRDIKIAREVMEEHREVLRKLAES